MSKQNESLEAKVGEFSVVEKTQTANPFSSEELLGFMLESAKDYSIFTTDADGRVTSWNAGAERFFGYPEAEILGQSAAILFTPEDREIGAPEQELSTAITEGRADDERWHLRKDGTRFWMSGMVRPHRDDAGRLQGFIKIGRDLTERKRAEEELQKAREELETRVKERTSELAATNQLLQDEITDRKLAQKALEKSEQQYRFLSEGIMHQVWTAQPDGNLDYVNGRTLEYFGMAFEQMINDGWQFLVHPDDVAGCLKRWTKSLETGEYYEVEFRLKKADGTYRWHSGRATAGRDSDGKIVKWFGTTTDINDKKSVENSLSASERSFRELVEILPIAVYVCDEQGGIESFNARAVELWGRTPKYKEIIDSYYGSYKIYNLNGGYLPHAEYPMAQVLRSGIPISNAEVIMERADGSSRTVMVNVIPRLDEQGNLTGAINCLVDITEQKRVKKSLRQAEANYRNLVELSPVIVYLAKSSPPYEAIYVSPNIIEFGYPAEEWFNKNNMWISLIHEDDLKRVLQMTEEAMNQNLETDLEYRMVAQDGSILWVHDKGRFISDEQGNKIGWQGVIVDVTETKQLEEQLRQSQKLESIGRLAGGIAHDFNNMLTAINGYSELTLRRMKEDDPLRHNIEEIKKAGDRSAELTRQLLAFSRQQILQPKLINLNEVINETSDMLQRLLGENIQFVSSINPKLGFVMADFGQLSQIILNLTVNAMDAMPQGGKLTIETANVFLDPSYALRHPEVISGAYVMLAVSDTGTGMDAETQKRIFEPFFTTKEAGRGTGLGLATVYGIVKQSGGNINAYSEEGVGTTFKIYLPRVAGQADVVDIESNGKELSPTAGTILLVEDEDIVRALTKQVLEECGYLVIEARNGVEALAKCDTGDCKFDLLMTDVVMPQMGGRELANKLKEKLPDLQILFTSGYTDDAVVRHGVIEVGTNFIQKPFTPDSLAKKVRELLGASEEKSG